MSNPEYASYIDDLLEKAMVKIMHSNDFKIDSESYEEIRSLAAELDDELIEPSRKLST